MTGAERFAASQKCHRLLRHAANVDCNSIVLVVVINVFLVVSLSIELPCRLSVHVRKHCFASNAKPARKLRLFIWSSILVGLEQGNM